MSWEARRFRLSCSSSMRQSSRSSPPSSNTVKSSALASAMDKRRVNIIKETRPGHFPRSMFLRVAPRLASTRVRVLSQRPFRWLRSVTAADVARPRKIPNHGETTCVTPSRDEWPESLQVLGMVVVAPIIVAVWVVVVVLGFSLAIWMLQNIHRALHGPRHGRGDE